MFKTLSRPLFICVSQSLPCSQGLILGRQCQVKYQPRGKIQRINVCLSVTQMKRHFVRNLCTNVYRKCLLTSGLVVHKSHGTAAILALPSYQQSWDAAFVGSVCLLFPALRFWHLHLFLPFVCCVLPSPLCVALGRAMKGVAAASHWVIRWGTNGNLDPRASRSPLFLGDASVRLGWLALSSRRLPAQRSLVGCPAFSMSSGAAQRSGVPCGVLFSWVVLPGKSLFLQCAL